MTAPATMTRLIAGRIALPLWIVVVALGPAACSATPGAADGATISCQPDSSRYQVDTYAPQMKKTGDMGALSFELVSSNPGPPVQGVNTFVVKISRTDGTPFPGELYIDPMTGVFMPLHGHSTSVPPVVTFDPTSGTYTLTPMDLFMPGLWRITLQGYETAPSPEAGSADEGGVDAGARSLVDIGAFYFCIE